MYLTCPSCGTQIQADDLGLTTELAKCRSCHAVMNIAEQLGAKSQPALAVMSAHLEVSKAARTLLQKSAAHPPRDRVPQPTNVRVRDHDDALEISSRLRLPWGIGGLIISCVIWNGSLVLCLLNIPGKEDDWVLLIPVAGALGMTYYVAGTLLNRIVVCADFGWVRVWHGPLPWWGGRKLPRAEIQQIYYQCSSDLNIGFDVMALLWNNHRVLLLHVRLDRALAEFIEQTLEDYLGIADRRVAGELPR